jgi:hypothetical protein
MFRHGILVKGEQQFEHPATLNSFLQVSSEHLGQDAEQGWKNHPWTDTVESCRTGAVGPSGPIPTNSCAAAPTGTSRASREIEDDDQGAFPSSKDKANSSTKGWFMMAATWKRWRGESSG